MQTPRQRRRQTLAMLGLAAVTVAALGLAVIDPSGLCALPALVLPLLFALRRYPGETILTAFSRGPRGRPRPTARVAVAISAALAMPRGGLLLARSLADRPPPRLSSAAA